MKSAGEILIQSNFKKANIIYLYDFSSDFSVAKIIS